MGSGTKKLLFGRVGTHFSNALFAAFHVIVFNLDMVY
jgi:hypothetical protein